VPRVFSCARKPVAKRLDRLGRSSAVPCATSAPPTGKQVMPRELHQTGVLLHFGPFTSRRVGLAGLGGVAFCYSFVSAVRLHQPPSCVRFSRHSPCLVLDEHARFLALGLLRIFAAALAFRSLAPGSGGQAAVWARGVLVRPHGVGHVPRCRLHFAGERPTVSRGRSRCCGAGVRAVGVP